MRPLQIQDICAHCFWGKPSHDGKKDNGSEVIVSGGHVERKRIQTSWQLLALLAARSCGIAAPLEHCACVCTRVQLTVFKTETAR